MIQALANSGTTIANIPSEINNLTIGQLLDIDVTDPDTSPLLKKLATYHVNEMSTFVENITIGDVMDDFSSYPTLNTPEVKSTKITNLDAVINVMKDNLTLQDLVDIGPSSPWILQQLGDKKLDELADAINTFTLGDFIEIDDTSSPLILRNLADVALDDLESEMNSLTLSDIMEIDPDDLDTPQIIIALKDVQILDGTSLSNKINTLKLNEIYKASECTGVFKYLWDENNNGDLAISQIPAAVNNLPVIKLLEDYIYIDDVNQAKYYDAIDGQYYAYSQLVGGLSPSGHEVTEYKRIDAIYWFLLTEEGETFTNGEKHYVLKNGASYTINSGLEKLTQNFAYHMQVEKLYDLYDAGLLDTSALNRSDLDTTYQGQPIGNMSMSDFLTACIHLIQTLPPYLT